MRGLRAFILRGTNGKGSVSHMLASVLQTSGYKTGLYTSPHMKDFRERIRINGRMISEQEVVDFVEKIKPMIEAIKPSFFEMTVAMAFDHFAKEHVDIAVIEVGLGGRLDSTNIIQPQLSIITNISLDHTQLLGNSIKDIAFEKAGIIKPNVPVIIGETHIESKEVFIATAKQRQADIIFADQAYRAEFSDKNDDACREIDLYKGDYPVYRSLTLDLTGQYQKKNIVTVIQSLDLLKAFYTISEKDIREGLKNVKQNTGLAGRWEILGRNPLIIADTGHNIAGIEEVVKQIRTLKYDHLRFIIGTVNDKNIDGMLSLLPREGIYYFTKADIPRALDEQILMMKAKAMGLHGNCHKTTKDAYKAAKSDATINDLIFIGGSTFIVAELI
jgi:dihydrofolate synthase / folylpolyglutamate synthase